MTTRKPLPEIARCACGCQALICGGYIGPAKEVSCQCGWSGPVRRTARGAILAWNRVMEGQIRIKKIQALADKARSLLPRTGEGVSLLVSLIGCLTRGGSNKYVESELKNIRRDE